MQDIEPGVTPDGAAVSLSAIRPGESVVYYRGFLAADRDRWRFRYMHGVGGRRPLPLTLAAHAYELYEAGKVTLTQRKLDQSNYEYIAVGRAG